MQEDPGAALDTTNKVWVKSLSTGKAFAVSNAPGIQTSPDVSGDVVVWADTRNSCPTCSQDVYGYRLSTGQEFPIATGESNQGSPAISGSIVVWQEEDNQTRAIRGLDLVSGQTLLIASANDTVNSGYSPPAIDGHLVVYVDTGTDGGLYAYNLQSHTRTKINDQFPLFYSVSGSRVAWAAGIVHVTDLSTGKDIVLPSAPYSSLPDIDGDQVVWSDSLPGSNNNRLVGYDLAEEALCVIHDMPGHDQLMPRLSGSIVVWMSDDNGPSNIAIQSMPSSCH